MLLPNVPPLQEEWQHMVYQDLRSSNGNVEALAECPANNPIRLC